MDKAENALFRISGIDYGWIFAEIETETKHIDLCNSYLGGRLMPKTFLQAFIDLYSKTKLENWICWHGESNSFIWHLKSRYELLELSIYEGESSFGLPLEGSALYKNIKSAPAIMETATWLHTFSLSVYNSFKYYSYGKGYELWQNSKYKDMFPRQEYSNLRKILRKAGNGGNS